MFEKTNRILAFVAVTLTILGIFYTPLYYSEESYGQGDLVQYNQGWVWEKGNEDIPVDLRNPIKTMGHLAGDNLIKFCADLIKEYLGDLGDCYRTGGDEFMVVIEHTDKALIAQRIEKIEAAVADLDRYKSFKIGMAAGMTSAKIPSDKTMADVIKRADKMMYQKKKEMKECQREKTIF